jgi:chromosome segregation ATPase
MGCSSSRPPAAASAEPSAAELEADRHEAEINELVQRYEHSLATARAEVTKAQEAYRAAQARENDLRLGQLSSRETKKGLEGKRQELRAAERRCESLQREMHDELADLRETQRTACRAIHAQQDPDAEFMSLAQPKIKASTHGTHT